MARPLLPELSKNPSLLWGLLHPKPQKILTALQNQTPVNMSGVTRTEGTITQNGQPVKNGTMKPDHALTTSVGVAGRWSALKQRRHIPRLGPARTFKCHA